MLSRVAHYAWGALVAPRATAREIVREPDLQRLAWAIVIASSLVTGLMSVVDEAYLVRFAPERSMLWETGIGQSVGFGLVFCGAFALSVVFFPLCVFLWKHLFGFRDSADEVVAATTLGFALSLLVEPVWQVLMLAGYLQDAFEVTDYAVWALLIVWLAIIGVYYSELLSIGIPRALVTNIAVTAIFFIPIVFVIFSAVVALGVMDGVEQS